MLIISAGMEKSGSGWYFNLTNDMLAAAGFQDSRVIRDRFGLQDVMEFYNCNVGELTDAVLVKLTAPPLDSTTFAAKTHSGPPRGLVTMIERREVKATYIYRDPRDVVLSLLDHGRKAREQEEDHVFGRIHTCEDAVEWIEHRLFPVWEEWHALEEVLKVRYEDLCADTLGEMRRLARFLDVELDEGLLGEIAGRYDPSNHRRFGTRGLHFNIGRSFRYVEDMEKSCLDLCRRRFESYLLRMDYPSS